ncbi:hypothetical protein, partial [Rhodoplanes sp. SY1]|uniref:hypothetical protein n=1 Tax=Rhodoplanes sp. SY1 TaxID=3166646 RepID=UPI0038B4D9A1
MKDPSERRRARGDTDHRTLLEAPQDLNAGGGLGEQMRDELPGGRAAIRARVEARDVRPEQPDDQPAGEARLGIRHDGGIRNRLVQADMVGVGVVEETSVETADV